jgi:SAM-dependent methyltransferase
VISAPIGAPRYGEASIASMGSARYDGLAEWYTTFRPALTPDELDALRRLLGRGSGRCLDVGCGTGVSTSAIADLGWSAVGVDVSDDLLELARARGLDVVRASADALPFADAEFDAAVSVWTHTDVDHFAATLREVVRVLHPGAPFVYISAHPCWVGPHCEFVGAVGVPRRLHPGYRPARRYADAPGVANPEGLRARVGAVHLPLGEFVDAFPRAGLRIERFEELGANDYPYVVAVRSRR